LLHPQGGIRNDGERKRLPRPSRLKADEARNKEKLLELEEARGAAPFDALRLLRTTKSDWQWHLAATAFI